jgi:hypothetical protein
VPLFASFALFQRTGPDLSCMFFSTTTNLYSFSNPYVHRLRKLRLIGRGFRAGRQGACLYEIVFFSELFRF